MSVNVKTAFKVSQVAGSLRMEGIVVSQHDERVIAGIIDGKIKADEKRRLLVERYKKQNAVIA
ncbi:MAG TPA: antitoxin VbhA family protein [Agitococcus sp.]|jgi:hypothetical protein|nr:antitoxin VbhA family protein [Agitococcus sp.]HNA22560.1 antitoxin VbhA family protein [Agitococcus sp.]